MDPRLERIVERLNTVRRQEQDALEVLQQAQEDGHQRVAVDVLDGALLEEDVGFVEQEHGAPGVRNVEDLLQLGFEGAGVGAQLAGGDHVEGAFEEFGDAFCGEGLACFGC